MADLYLTVDVGGSMTKIIYQLPTWSAPRYLLMSPDIEKVNVQRFNEYQGMKGWIGNPRADQEAWLFVDKQVYVVGAMADRFNPEDRLGELKYENALYKVLAAVGIIVQEHISKKKRKLNLALGILLPYLEYNDRKKFEQKLKKLLESYQFRGQSLLVKLEKFICRPEGGGLVIAILQQQGMNWLKEKRIGVLMFGHRNVTALHFDYGQLKTGDSPMLGFSQLLDRACSLKSGLNRDKLADSISAAKRESLHRSNSGWMGRYPKWSELSSIKALATAKDAELRQKEIQEIEKAIEIATYEYWQMIERWLKNTLPDRLDEVVISGGAANFIERDLEIFFNCEENKRISYFNEPKGKYQPKTHSLPFIPITWGHEISFIQTEKTSEGKKEIKVDIEKIFPELEKSESKEQSLSSRLLDPYGLFAYLVTSVALEAVS